MASCIESFNCPCTMFSLSFVSVCVFTFWMMRATGSSPHASSPLRPLSQAARPTASSALNPHASLSALSARVWWRYRDPSSGQFYFASADGGQVTWEEPITGRWLDAEAASPGKDQPSQGSPSASSTPTLDAAHRGGGAPSPATPGPETGEATGRGCVAVTACVGHLPHDE